MKYQIINTFWRCCYFKFGKCFHSSLSYIFLPWAWITRQPAASCKQLFTGCHTLGDDVAELMLWFMCKIFIAPGKHDDLSPHVPINAYNTHCRQNIDIWENLEYLLYSSSLWVLTGTRWMHCCWLYPNRSQIKIINRYIVIFTAFIFF